MSIGKLLVYVKESAPCRYLARAYYKLLKYLRFIMPFYNCSIMVALTYRCQCACQHCCSGLYKKDQKQELRKGEIMKLIDEFSDLGGKDMIFFGGEPLLIPELVDFIKYAKQKRLRVSFDTNGFLLDEDKVRDLKEAGLDIIGVSIDSPFEAVHDELRGVKGIFERAVSGIKYCKEYDISCYITTYVTKDKLKNGEIQKLINLAKSLGVKVRLLSPIRGGKWLDRKDVVLSPEEVVILRSFLEPNTVYWEMPTLDKADIPFSCSSFLKDYFYISAYGDVQPCCFFPLSFGNIREEPLSNIVKKMWDSDLFKMHDKSGDCLFNNENFRNRYSKLIGSGVESLKRFDQYSLQNDAEEWDTWAPVYDEQVSYSSVINYDLICSRLEFKSRDILDLCCGTGTFTEAIANRANHITALDSSAKMLEEAKRKLKGFCNISFEKADIEKIPLSPDRNFDIIVSINSMHHIMNIEEVIERLKSCLAKGGQIVIVDHLIGGSIKNSCLYFLKVIQNYGLWKCFHAFLDSKFLPKSRLRKHLSRETHMTYEDFKNRYGALLPGAQIEIINGVFGFLVWTKCM